MHVPVAEVRRNEIENRLKRGEPVNATALAEEFSVSEDAIRRDLRALAAEGKCKRVYGGAMPLSPGSGPIAERLTSDIQQKHALSLAALPLLSKVSTLFLDSGSTNLAFAREIPLDRPLTVVTNSISIAATLLERKNFKVIIIGGEIDPDLGAAIGPSAMREVERYNFDLCFLGACAVSVSLGLGAFHLADAEFKRALIERSECLAALITRDKVETRAPFQIADLAVLDHMVLEHDTGDELLATFYEAGPSVVLAKP
jgi:DeoR/GlpR family transcriptional regulator of sugar metabolism